MMDRDFPELDQRIAGKQEREAADALLRDCYRALIAACCSENGLDSSEGVPLLHRLEARFPDLKVAADRDYRP